MAQFFPGRTDISLKSHWLLMQRRVRKVTNQYMTLVRVLDPYMSHGHRLTGTSARKLLPVPIGITRKTASAFPSDDDWDLERDLEWDLQEPGFTGADFDLSQLL
jgi:hypothetical protein